MIESEKKNVEFYEDVIQLGGGGEVLHLPLARLYYHYKDPGREPANHNYLTFAGDHLASPDTIGKVNVFCLEFSGEPEPDREAWADPLRAETLKQLTGEGRSWYFGFISDETERLLLQDDRRVSEELFEYLTNKGPEKLIILDSPKPYGYGIGVKKKVFFEVSNQEIEWIVDQVWDNAYSGYSIEGYNFASEEIGCLRKWNEIPRDARLFEDVIKKTTMMFYTYPAEHRDFIFLTNKLGFSDFEQKINLEDLKKKAEDM